MTLPHKKQMFFFFFFFIESDWIFFVSHIMVWDTRRVYTTLFIYTSHLQCHQKPRRQPRAYTSSSSLVFIVWLQLQLSTGTLIGNRKGCKRRNQFECPDCEVPSLSLSLSLRLLRPYAPNMTNENVDYFREF